LSPRGEDGFRLGSCATVMPGADWNSKSRWAGSIPAGGAIFWPERVLERWESGRNRCGPPTPVRPNGLPGRQFDAKRDNRPSHSACRR